MLACFNSTGASTVASSRKMQRKQEKRSQRRGHKQRSAAAPSTQSKRRDVSVDELHAIIDRAKSALSPEDQEKLTDAVDTLAYLTQELDTKGTSIRRLRKMLFGSSSEKTRHVVGASPGVESASADSSEPPTESSPEPPMESSPESSGTSDFGNQPSAGDGAKVDNNKPKGHGRNPASAYTGAKRTSVPHESLAAKDACPKCPGGKVYPMTPPARLMRVTGVSPIVVNIYELERLRCNLCGEVFTAEAPLGVGDTKYDETAAAMIALLKYGTGLPFNRIERLQRGFGVPLPASTQWELVEKAAALLAPAYAELIRQAAQGRVLYNDDTTMKVLELDDIDRRNELDVEGQFEGRTGVFTSGIVSTSDEHQIALFFTGQKHAGENIAGVLAQRATELSPPIQMCDALSRNVSGDFESFVANCNAHARRNFVDVNDNFPDEVRHVLETWSQVFHNEARAKQERLNPEARLAYHKQHSGPLMDDLKAWCQALLNERKIEPNAGLGMAIKYLTKHWHKLTLFLTMPGAPLDNNICERAVKMAILHRKNALFYKTLNGARVGDLFMSFIHTTELNKLEPFDYLVALQRHHQTVEHEPAAWMPWNYTEALARLTTPIA
jgi:transposase